MGQTTLAHVEGTLRTILRQAISGFCDPGSLLRRQRIERVLAAKSAVAGEVSPTVRDRLHLDRLWSEAFDIAVKEIDAGPFGVPPVPRACPFTLDELLADDFTYDHAVKQLYVRLTSWRPQTAERAAS